jgi:hypothetical protein
VRHSRRPPRSTPSRSLERKVPLTLMRSGGSGFAAIPDLAVPRPVGRDDHVTWHGGRIAPSTATTGTAPGRQIAMPDQNRPPPSPAPRGWWAVAALTTSAAAERGSCARRWLCDDAPPRACAGMHPWCAR